eukprot:4626362-Pleurochrysis_carterae.AAC.1
MGICQDQCLVNDHVICDRHVAQGPKHAHLKRDMFGQLLSKLLCPLKIQSDSLPALADPSTQLLQRVYTRNASDSWRRDAKSAESMRAARYSQLLTWRE